MVSKKSSGRSVPNVSAAASKKQAKPSSVLRSAFSPSKFQLSLFASVIQALDSQQLRIHDTNSGRLRCEHTPQRTHITCLDWGFFGSGNRNNHQEPSKKKRKKLAGSINGSHADHGDTVVAFGTNHSEIQLFSPAEAKVVATLKGAHAHGIRDFKFKDHGSSFEAWSLDGDGKIVQWDLRNGTSLRSIPTPTTSVNVLLPLSSSLLVASQAAYLLDPTSPANTISFPGCANTIHSIAASHSGDEQRDPALFLVASDSDRYMNVYDVPSKSLIGSLITTSDVEGLAIFQNRTLDATDDYSKNEIVAAITKDGELEVFGAPFRTWVKTTPLNSKDLKANRIQRTRNATASIKVIRPDDSLSYVPIISASFQDQDLVLALSEGSVNLSFKKIPWRKEEDGELALAGSITLEKVKSAGIEAATMNGIKDIGRAHVDESHAVVTQGGQVREDAMMIEEPEVIDISSAEEVEEDSESDNQMDLSGPSTKVNGIENEDTKMYDQPAGSNGKENDGDEDSPAEEPSFGDLIRANTPATIDVATSFPDQSRQAMVISGEGLPSGISLGTVLAQSLRTNDVSLLESCFHVQDLHIVRATIERLDSALATTLLQKLAERLHGRPGRAGSLMVWIQWTLVAHGGYLAAQPDVVKKLSSLSRVVQERANSLQPLLSLKGKLDMLEAQMNLRRSMQRRYGTGDAEDDENDGVIYVEGQDDASSTSSDESDANPASTSVVGRKLGGRKSSTSQAVANDESEAEESDEMEALEDGSGVSDEDEDSDAEALIDNETSEVDNDSDDEEFADEVDHDDLDSNEEGESSENDDPRMAAKGKTQVVFLKSQFSKRLRLASVLGSKKKH